MLPGLLPGLASPIRRGSPTGPVTWNGATYDSLSTAGGMARKSIVGAPPGREYPQTNGWTFWRFRDTDGHLAFVDALRQRVGVGNPDSRSDRPGTIG
jgi:hypothetical protein